MTQTEERAIPQEFTDLRQARKDHGLPLRLVAARISELLGSRVSVASVSEWERGAHRPDGKSRIEAWRKAVRDLSAEVRARGPQ